MNLTGVISVSGKPGLFKLLAKTKSGFVLESLDEKKNKLVANLNTQKFTSLEDTTIFSLTEEDIRLSSVLEKMSTHGAIPDIKASNDTLRDFFGEIAPTHDDEQVYISDIKKIISWYHLLKDLPLFTEALITSEKEAELNV